MPDAAAPPTPTIGPIEAEAFPRWREPLAAILIECVDNDASVGFLAPLPPAEALAYWDGVGAALASGAIKLFGAWVGGELVGTVQLHPIQKPNQPHRAEIAKLQVALAARGRGLGAALMRAAEAAALALGRDLLVLDTARYGGAERLYDRLGWSVAGIVPDYALHPDGRYCDTVFYWKRLRPR